MHWQQLKDKRVAILGAGREGLAAVSWLRERLPNLKITVLDNGRGLPEGAVLPEDVQQFSAPVDGELLSQFDVVVRSPGFSPYREPLRDLDRRSVALTSASNLWFADPSANTCIVVTGTKGKSTTASLLHAMLAAAGLDVQLGGNIGRPVMALPEAEIAVVELSSYQLCDLNAAPAACAVLNLYPEHLDWHGCQARYYTDKLRLLEQLPAERLWLGAAGGDLRAELAGRPQINDHAHWVGANVEQSGLRLDDKGLWLHGKLRLARADLPLSGSHQWLNIQMAWQLARHFGADSEACLLGLQRFRALPHRFQYLGELGARHIIDDSIATTPHATRAALRALPEPGSVVLLVGGHDRGLDWSVFTETLCETPVRAVITMGQNGRRIAESVRRHCPEQFIEQADSLAEACHLGLAASQPGDHLLLSPGAPSFGEFSDFIERGKAFAAVCEVLIGEEFEPAAARAVS